MYGSRNGDTKTQYRVNKLTFNILFTSDIAATLKNNVVLCAEHNLFFEIFSFISTFITDSF